MTDTKITDDMLHAFVDGQLDDTDMARVEAYLNDNPDRAHEVGDWAMQNASIRELFPEYDGSIDLPGISPEIMPAVANTNRAPWRSIAAAVALLAVGLGVGWYGRGITSQNTEIQVAGLVQQAIAAHAVFAADANRPVELDTSQEALLIGWLSKRVGEQLAAPNLSANGFTLIGGRLLSVSEGPAAQFMYENDAGQRITLFAARSDNSQMAAFQYKQDGPTGSFHWQDENLRYAVIGDLPRNELNKVANAVYKAFL